MSERTRCRPQLLPTCYQTSEPISNARTTEIAQERKIGRPETIKTAASKSQAPAVVPKKGNRRLSLAN